jgi:cephalosporin hydroxylase
MTSDRLAMGCGLPREFLEGIQNGTLNYRYKGVQTYKNPFDLALYQLLLWEHKPLTLIEIGSFRGGSAMWFADTMRNFGINYNIISVDIRASVTLEIPGVTFCQGNARNLGATLTPELMSALPRPLMVVEDSDHHPATTLAVLRFFDSWLRAGEHIIIEDGIVNDLFTASELAGLGGGPRPGIADFLRERGSDYEIDTRYCDYFGPNVTWNVNGYLRRMC